MEADPAVQAEVVPPTNPAVTLDLQSTEFVDDLYNAVSNCLKCVPSSFVQPNTALAMILKFPLGSDLRRLCFTAQKASRSWIGKNHRSLK